MKTTIKSLAMVLLFTSTLFSQTVYDIPFASEGNIIELTVSNESGNDLGNVIVEAVEYPSWIKINENKITLTGIKKGEEVPAAFKFSVTKGAEIGKESEIKFNVTNNGGSLSSKVIKIKVMLPQEYKLEQNYPNPFNPTTTIKYSIPNVETGHAPSLQRVTLKIYDILGREVATLIDEKQPAGYYEKTFNGSQLSSGIYIYRLTAGSYSSIKKMMLIK